MSEYPDGEVALEYKGKRFTLVLDWAAIAWFERASDSSMFDFYATVIAGRPKLSHLAWFLMAMMQRHHPDVTLDDAGAMAMDDTVRAQLDLAAEAALPAGQGDEPGNGEAAAAD